MQTTVGDSQHFLTANAQPATHKQGRAPSFKYSSGKTELINRLPPTHIGQGRFTVILLHHSFHPPIKESPGDLVHPSTSTSLLYYRGDLVPPYIFHSLLFYRGDLVSGTLVFSHCTVGKV